MKKVVEFRKTFYLKSCSIESAPFRRSLDRYFGGKEVRERMKTHSTKIAKTFLTKIKIHHFML